MSLLYLVDTSAWIFALRRNPVKAIRQRIEDLIEIDAVATCNLVELELLGGTASEQEFSRLQVRLLGLHRLLIEEQDWEAAARLAFSLRRSGVTVPFTDVLLGTVALRHGIQLLHADRDFDLMARHSALQVESWVNAVARP